MEPHDAAAHARRLESLLATLDFTVAWEADPDTLDLTWVSPRAEHVTGFTADEWVARGAQLWRDRVPGEDLPKVLELFGRAKDHGPEGSRVDHRFVRKDGRVLWLHAGVVFGRRGDTGVPALHGASTDITALKTAESSARDAVAARDALLGVIAHDLRSHLHVIVLDSNLIARAAREAAPLPPALAQVGRWAESTLRAGRDMLRLIGDLLDVESLEAGRLAIEPRPQGAATLLGDALDATHELVAASGARIDVDVVDPSAVVRCDRQRILQVFLNLVGNAIKFTPAGGLITLRAAPDGEHVRFTVRDTGPGVQADQLARLWERGWKGDPGDRRGAGLGLFITRGIVEAHGGRVSVESTPGEGATFSFTLPRAQPP